MPFLAGPGHAVRQAAGRLLRPRPRAAWSPGYLNADRVLASIKAPAGPGGYFLLVPSSGTFRASAGLWASGPWASWAFPFAVFSTGRVTVRSRDRPGPAPPGRGVPWRGKLQNCTVICSSMHPDVHRPAGGARAARAYIQSARRFPFRTRADDQWLPCPVRRRRRCPPPTTALGRASGRAPSAWESRCIPPVRPQSPAVPVTTITGAQAQPRIPSSCLP